MLEFYNTIYYMRQHRPSMPFKAYYKVDAYYNFNTLEYKVYFYNIEDRIWLLSSYSRDELHSLKRFKKISKNEFEKGLMIEELSK